MNKDIKNHEKEAPLTLLCPFGFGFNLYDLTDLDFEDFPDLEDLPDLDDFPDFDDAVDLPLRLLFLDLLDFPLRLDLRDRVD